MYKDGVLRYLAETDCVDLKAMVKPNQTSGMSRLYSAVRGAMEEIMVNVMECFSNDLGYIDWIMAGNRILRRKN